MTKNFPFRMARAGEGARLADIELESARKYITQPGFEDFLVGLVARPEKYVAVVADGRAFVAVNEHDWPIGFCALGEMDGEAYLAELCVARDYQGHGLGRRLIERGFAWARERGYPSMLLSTFREIPWNASYYQRQGFRILPPAELSKPGIARQRAHEAEFLDLDARVFMRKSL